ncbi:MAG TPA: hypothetical protein VEG30_04510 [Terriglobales bacterium]|nr:hypothetical protein [Terriglobales bacterium]
MSLQTQGTEHKGHHPNLGLTFWYTVQAGGQSAPRGAWQHIDLPAYASELQGFVAFAWPCMDAFYEEDERIVGHAADSYHRIDIRPWSAIVTASLPILNGPWFSTNPALRRAGTFHVPISMNLRSLPWNARPSARIRAYAATTTSVTLI